MTAIRWLGFAAGVLLVAGTGTSIVKTLLVPRTTRSLITRVVSPLVRGPVMAAARVDDLALRERILSAGAPAWLVTLLAAWLACLITGFGLMLWPLNPGGFPAALTESGSSLFTLGFIHPVGPAQTVIVFLAGASGLAVVALLIAYLPALYGAFNRRETLVTMLEALAGAPPWGPELLARQALIGDIAYLHVVYDRWAAWAADISESHTNYRTLMYFRSPDPTMSWLLGLLAVLDAAALHLALCPASAPPEARPALRVGYLTMRSLATGMGLAVPDDPHPEDPIALTREEFDAAAEHLRRAGWVFEREPDQAWPHFHGWRVNYERAAYALAHFLDLPPAAWSGPRPRHRQASGLPVRPPHREPRAVRGPGAP
jgi:hypothetical protein